MYIEKRVAFVNDNIINSIISIGIPNSVKDLNEFALKKAKEIKKELNIQSELILLDDPNVEEGFELIDGKFYEREKKEFCIAFYSSEFGVKFVTFEEYSDGKTLKNTLSLMFPDVSEFFIVPVSDIEYMKSLPLEALDLSSPDIVIERN